MIALTNKDIKRFWSYVNKAPAYKKGSGCWIWEGSKDSNAQGRFYANGRYHSPARVAYELVTGEACPEKPMRRLCGDPWCINPKHMVYGGNKNYNLTYKDIYAIKNAMLNEYREGLGVELAKRYNVSAQTIYNIAHGKCYAHIHVPGEDVRKSFRAKRLTEEQKQAIVGAYDGKRGTISALAREHGVTHQAVRYVLKKRGRL